MKGLFANVFCPPFLTKARRVFSRLPRELRIILGTLAGGFIGLMGGIAGVIIGLVLGYLVQELFGQFRNDREIRAYYENPGKSAFYEGEPGLAAFCGLGVLITAKSARGNGEAAIEETSRAARRCFFRAVSGIERSGADPGMIEHFCRIAWLEQKNLNPDLLLESLVSRRREKERIAEIPAKDLARLGEALYSLASSEKALDLAEELRVGLDPEYKPVKKTEPWKILGISPETPLPEVKAHYRRLAAQFHPDTLQALDEKRRETAARAFIAIQEAYREVMRGAGHAEE